MGKRQRHARQTAMWIAATDLPTTAAHPFYDRLNRILDEAGFDAYVERLCAPLYAPTMGRPCLAPGRYFRLLLIGYFRSARLGARDRLARGGFLREPAPASRVV